jgi:hypothetical protein
MFTAPVCGRNMTFIQSVGRCVVGTALAILLLSEAPSAHAIVVTDDFSDGNDTTGPTWTHLDGYLASSNQTWDASTGVYRMTAPPPGLAIGYNFVGSHVGPSFEDVRVSMDLVEFHKSLDGEPGPSFPNIIARSNGDNGLGTLTAYAYGLDPVSGNDGEVVLYRIDAGVDINDLGAQRATLEEGKDYRFILEVIGGVIHGQVYNLTDGGLVSESFAKIDAPADPFYASGTSGAIGYTQDPFTTTFAIDHFRTETAIAGDYNRDGSTDAADYVVWRKTVGQQTPQLEPDPSFQVVSLGVMHANGVISGTCNHTTSNCEVIDDADYAFWALQFGSSVGAGGGAGGGGSVVPEPASGVVLLLGFIGATFVRRRRAR